jgi:hypothetical protein
MMVLKNWKPLPLKPKTGQAGRRSNTMIDPKTGGKQVMDLYKTWFDNSYSEMMMLIEQMERMGAMYWGQMVNLPEEIKKGMSEWTKSYKKNCEDFKKVMDDSFKKLESLAA